MVSLQMHSLLAKVAAVSELQKKTISRIEITQKINELKYLSAQRNIPRMTLRKELIHLEHKLRGLDKLEEDLRKKERRENTQVVMLKKQVQSLRARIAASEDKDLSKKMEKLVFLLGECLAKQEIQNDIALAQKIKEEALGAGQENRQLSLQRKLELLKRAVEVNRLKGLDQERIARLEAQIRKIEATLRGEAPGEVKHEMLFKVESLPPQKRVVLN